MNLKCWVMPWWCAWLFALAGCGSPLVGLECRSGYERCGGACFDLTSDAQHCGGCNISCEEGELCIDGACSFALGDAGLDASLADAAVDTDAGDASMSLMPPICMGPGSPDDCICGLGQLKCDTSCREVLTDPEHCGACDNSCGADSFCVEGSCTPDCDPPYTRCGFSCLDLSSNPYHCGACGNACASGLCFEGQCIGATAGHVIAIGHDLSRNTTAIQRLFGNAVFLPAADPVRVLTFDQKTRAIAKTGFMQAMASASESRGRNYTLTNASPLAVTFLLSTAHVFVIEAQSEAKNSALIKNGEAWSQALKQFLKRGGVIVLLEGPGGKNAGTFQILKAAGLFDAEKRVTVGATKLSLVAPGDGVATGVPSVYRSGAETVGFEIDEPTIVVSDPETDTPVVVHIAR